MVFMVMFVMTPLVYAEDSEHFYSESGNNVNLEDNVDGSTTLAGEHVTTTGEVKGIAFNVGNNVEFAGTADYAVLAGNSITIDGTINNDTFVAGNLVNITENANLDRDVIIAGSEVEISGTIGRNISIYAGSVTFKGANITGSVKVYSSNIKVDDETVVEGNFSYPEDASIELDEKIVAGQIIKTDPINSNEVNIGNILLNKLISLASLLLTFAVLSLIFGRFFTRIEKKYEKMDFNLGIETFTKGLVILILVPIIMIFLFCIRIGIPLAFVLLALYIIAIYLSTIFTAYLLGYKLWQKFAKKDGNTLLIGVIGLVIIVLLGLIPGVSTFVTLFTLLIGLGVMYDVIKNRE